MHRYMQPRQLLRGERRVASKRRVQRPTQLRAAPVQPRHDDGVEEERLDLHLDAATAAT